MEVAIEALQDKIVYLAGLITLMKERKDISELNKQNAINKWNKQLEELKNAQTILQIATFKVEGL